MHGRGRLSCIEGRVGDGRCSLEDTPTVRNIVAEGLTKVLRMDLQQLLQVAPGPI